MKLSYEWLSTYLDLEGVSAQDLADRFTDAGLEVERVEPRSSSELAGLVVGLVLDCAPHPNADKLKVCRVDIGQASPSVIVCGAPNVASRQKVVVAVPGAVLPSGSIGVVTLRGVESQGMLCSAKEIGLETRLLPKEQTAGLYLLPDSASVGSDVVRLLALDDWILDISLTANRSDCLSMRGLAYEASALLNRPLRLSALGGGTASNPTDTALGPVRIRLETPACLHYEAQVLEQVQVASSPLWLQMRLLAMGIRPISNIVDITNYVMLEWGQPLHAFDLNQVHGGTIVVRQATVGETIITLDGEQRALTTDTMVIADAVRAIGIAGVMGGQNSEIGPQTVRVVLESAAFDPTSVRRTGQHLGLRSEAQQRFEKGIDPLAVHAALTRATELFSDICRAVPVGAPVRASHPEQAWTDAPRTLDWQPEAANRLLGTAIPVAEMQSVFERLGLSVQPVDDADWLVSIPTRRPDLQISADLVEEVARVHGYDHIPSSLPSGATTVGVRNASQRLRKVTRETLASAGLFETFTYTFTHPDAIEALRLADDSPLRRMIPLRHPQSDERTVLRTHLLPGLAQVAAHNMAHGLVGGQIFELGRVYLPPALPITTIVPEPWLLGMLWFGDVPRSIGVRRRPYDFYDAKGIVQSWLEALGAGAVSYDRVQDVSWLHPGRSAEVRVGDNRIGCVGELHPETAEALGTPRALYAEFTLSTVLAAVDGRVRVQRYPKFPAVARDLAVLVAADVAAGDLVKVALATANPGNDVCLEACEVFDVYAGKGVPEGHKSVAISFVYRHSERTMTDDEVGVRENEILSAWDRMFGASLRAGI